MRSKMAQIFDQQPATPTVKRNLLQKTRDDSQTTGDDEDIAWKFYYSSRGGFCIVVYIGASRFFGASNVQGIH